MATSDADRRKSFETIATAKGMPIHFTDAPQSNMSTNNIHLDLNIVEQVIKDAIIAVDNMLENPTPSTKSDTLSSIKEKLIRLSKSGTAYEKVTFAFSRGRYIFPEDVALLAKSASASASLMSSAHRMDCETICNFICNCICDNNQHCDQFCENVCHDICSVRTL